MQLTSMDFVHSHRFVAANTALPFVNRRYPTARETEEKFLQDRKVSVDIFAISPDRSGIRTKRALPATQPCHRDEVCGRRRSGNADSVRPPVATAAPLPVTAPLNRVNPGGTRGRYRSRRRGRADAQRRAFLSGRHRGRVRLLAGAERRPTIRAGAFSGAAGWKTEGAAQSIQARNSIAHC